MDDRIRRELRAVKLYADRDDAGVRVATIAGFAEGEDMPLARLNLELDTDLLGAAVEVSGARSKREAIEIALLELVRRHRLAEIVKRGGTVTQESRWMICSAGARRDDCA